MPDAAKHGSWQRVPAMKHCSTRILNVLTNVLEGRRAVMSGKAIWRSRLANAMPQGSGLGWLGRADGKPRSDQVAHMACGASWKLD